MKQTGKAGFLLWLPVWLVAIVVLADTFVLRKELIEVSIQNAQVEKGIRRGYVCKLSLNIPSRWGEGTVFQHRTARESACELLEKGQVISLHRSLLMDRWVSIQYKNHKIGLLDNNLILDLSFITLAIVLPVVFSRGNTRRSYKAYVFLAFLIGLTFYYMISFFA